MRLGGFVLAAKLKKEKAIHILPLWVFMENF